MSRQGVLFSLADLAYALGFSRLEDWLSLQAVRPDHVPWWRS